MLISYGAVLAAGIMPVVCAGIAKSGFKGYDNSDPRAWLARQTGFRARANAAQANCFEAFPFLPSASSWLCSRVLTRPRSTRWPCSLLQHGWRMCFLRHRQSQVAHHGLVGGLPDGDRLIRLGHAEFADGLRQKHRVIKAQ